MVRHINTMLFFLPSAIYFSSVYGWPTTDASTSFVLPYNTEFAKLWQDRNQWYNTTNPMLEKRANSPHRAGQFVAYSRSGNAKWTISLAVVIYENRNTVADCNALWDVIWDSKNIIATAIAENAKRIISQSLQDNASPSTLWFNPNSLLPSETRAFYTEPYNGNLVVIAKIVYNGLPQGTIAAAAKSLADAWGLGYPISYYEPVNSNSRRLSKEKKNGVVSEGQSWSKDHLDRLQQILNSLPRGNKTEAQNRERRDAAVGRCWDIDVTACRNHDWSVWDTRYDAWCGND